jgi:drug/metabolite transporter (DMT)-like permease
MFWTAATVTSWGIWAVLAKLIGDGLTGGQSQALSSIGMVPVILALAWSTDRVVRPGGRRGVFYALAGGAVSGLGNVPYYELYARGGTAATAVSLTALYPVVTIALAAVFLGERVNRVQAVGLALALAAIYLFNVSQESGILSGWLGYAFLPMALWGTAGFLSKLATAHLSGKLAALLLLIGFLLANLGLLVVVPWPTSVPLPMWGLVVALGFFLAFGNYTVVLAYADGKASVITPLAGLYPVVSVPVAILLLGETIGVRTALGIGCALAAVLALSLEAPSRGAADGGCQDC